MKAIVVGDNLITGEILLSRSDPLRRAGFEIQAFEWLASDRNVLNRWNLNIETHGPDAEPPPEGLEDSVRDADVLITHFAPVPGRIIDAGRRLKVIGVARGGWENIAVDTATKKGVPVVHIVGRNANAVAEFTVGMIIDETRNIARSDRAMRRGIWYNRRVDPEDCFELRGKVVGLIGFGAIGKRVAQLLSTFDARVLVHDPFVTEAVAATHGAARVELEELLRRSDIVSLHARLSSDTEGLIGARELALMKSTAYLINTARAGLVKREALITALRDHHIAGAAIDVFWTEPLPPDTPLAELDNLTITSHLAGTTIDALYLSAELVVDAVVGYLSGGETDLVINSEVLSNG